ncbi:MFS transporter, partial [Devosia sp.]|uniref:MFS transporter n=1 Tax=Devosia sp. TaxID=1871048 RepID=UPI0032646824
AARVLQGLGGGGLMTSAFGIMADLFEPRERARYQGYSSAVFTLSSIIGPVAGGIIAQSLGWEYIFLINLPIGVAAIAVLLWQMPHTETGRQPRIDVAGGVLLAACVTGTVYWAENVLNGGFGPAMVYGMPLVIVAALIAFIVVERRAPEPVVPLHLFADRTVALSLLISVVGGISTLGMLNYFALFLQTITSLPPALAGLLFLPSAVGALVGSIGSGNLVSRTGRYKLYPILSMVVGVATMLGFAMVGSATPLWWICVLMFFFSLSIGLQTQTIMVAVQNAAPRQDVGAATGTVTLSRMVGASLGLAINGGLLTAALVRGQAGMPAEQSAQLPQAISSMTPDVMSALPVELHAAVVNVFSSAFASIYYFGAAMFLVGLVCAALMPDVKLAGRDAPKLAGEPDAMPATAAE